MDVIAIPIVLVELETEEGVERAETFLDEPMVIAENMAEPPDRPGFGSSPSAGKLRHLERIEFRFRLRPVRQE